MYKFPKGPGKFINWHLIGFIEGKNTFFVVSTLWLFLSYLKKHGHNEKCASSIFSDLSKPFDITKRNIGKLMNSLLAFQRDYYHHKQ